MADAVVAPRKKKNPRVERRGRFTITEIEPDSPASSTMGEAPTYRTHAEMQDGHISEEDEDGDGPHHESGEDGDVEGDDDDDHGGGGQRHSLVRESALEAAAVLFSTSTSERISPFGSAVFEHSTSSTERVVDTSGDGVSLNIETAVNNERLDEGDGDGDGVERRIRSATIDATERRIRSPTFDETSSQDNRRVKQKGRFTIIELSSDSPRSRKNSAEEFSNTTSISVTSTQVSQANQASTQSLGTSPGTSSVSYGHVDTNGTTASAVFARMVSETNTAPTRTSRSLVVEASRRGRENDSRRANLGGRRSTGRLHSVSPLRERTFSDRFSHQELGSSYGGTCSTTSVRGQSFDPLLVNTSPQFRPAPSPSNGMSSMSLSSSYSSSMAGTTPTGHSSSRQSGPELGANKRHLASRQKAITISAEQFIQQQHTIASLIRQQQELKQLIGVLAEQQQHLVAMPKELADFRLDQAQSDSHEESMREVHLQVGALSRANDALQQLLSEAEQDASERTMEIECLSNENNEIRYRFSNLERRYHEEKKRSLTLEQELQRTRRALYTARHKDKGDLQKYQQKLSRASSREVEDPVPPSSPAKVLF